MLTLSRRAVGIRGLCAGALGGAFAAGLDFALCQGEAARFMPHGVGRLFFFLAPLYAAMGGLAGMLAGLGLRLLGATDLGPLADAGATSAKEERAALGPVEEEPRGASLLVYVLGGALALALHGVAIHFLVLDALRRFHAHLPIAALVALVATALALPAAALTCAVATALRRLLPVGPRLFLGRRMPLGWIALWWSLGLGAALAGVLVLVDGILLRPRMTPGMRALNAALWTPAVVTAALFGAHAFGRLGWRVLGRIRRIAAGRGGWLDRPLAAALVVMLLTALGAALGLKVLWPVAKLVHWQPIGLGVVAAAVAVLVATSGLLGARLDALRPALRFGLVVFVPLGLLGTARLAGQPDRVRKAASTAFLGPPLLMGVQAASDWDGDRFSSTLGFGPDCNDRDPEVHPGAFDWPDDGMDQNCNGHQATVRPAPRPPFAALPASVPAPLNVVLISIDALRADHVGAYGYSRPTTPAIDALARESILFQDGWAHSPSTRYSVPAILIGRYESTIAWDPHAHWPPLVLPENHLLSEMFHERGYHTGALLPAHYFEPGWGLVQGFDDYDNSLARLHANPFGGDPARTTGSSSRELADLAIAWLGRHAGPGSEPGAKPAQPFFLWMHFYDPHYLYERHPEVPSFGSSQGADEVADYDNEVRYTDLHIGRVLDALRTSGTWDRTVVVLTADHGEGFGEHGVRQHGYHIYAQQNKVPFLIRVPGIAPRVVQEPVGHVDLYPTLLNLLRAPDEPQLLGQSLVGLMLGGAEPDRAVFGEVEYEGPVVRKSVVSRGWHLIHNVVPDDTFELYHLTTDPAEAHDLYQGGGAGPASPTDQETRLRETLVAWMDETALPLHFAERVSGNVASSPFPVATRLDADIDGLLVLDGATLHTQVVRPGEAVDLEVVMHVPARMPPGWRLFTHVAAIGPQGTVQRFLNADHEPVEGFVPLSRMRPGQYLRDRLRVTLPPGWPTGALEVRCGLWKGPVRAPVRGGGDFVVVARAEVRP
jgi:arylsulfatase A-like enzyme